MRSASPVVLIPQEKQELVEKVQRGQLPAHILRRVQIILLAGEGMSDTGIARRLGISRITVSRWRNRFLENRTEILGKISGTGRKQLGEDAKRRVIEMFQSRTPKGKPPSLRKIARATGISVGAVWKIGREEGFTEENKKPGRSKRKNVHK